MLVDEFKGQKVQDVKKHIQKLMLDKVSGSVHTAASELSACPFHSLSHQRNPWGGSAALRVLWVTAERGTWCSWAEWAEQLHQFSSSLPYSVILPRASSGGPIYSLA